MNHQDAVTRLATESERLAAAADDNLEAAVPSCPGWTLADLVVHTGGMHRAHERLLSTRSQEPLGIQKDMFEGVPRLLDWLEHSTLFGERSDPAALPQGVLEWFREGASKLVETLRGIDPEEPVWSWSDDHTARHYLRLLPIETGVHRWDAQAAAGVVPEHFAQDLSVAGISHTFEVMVPFRRRVANAPKGLGEAFYWVAEDVGSSWSLAFVEGSVVVQMNPVNPSASVTTRSTAENIFLYLWGRLPSEPLDVEGDRTLFDRYFELVPPL